MVCNEVLDYLGKRVKDRISGCEGVVSSVCFDLYGCIQVLINPGRTDKDGKPIDAVGWLDINRIKILSNKRIMEPLGFEERYDSLQDVGGPELKPLK